MKIRLLVVGAALAAACGNSSGTPPIPRPGTGGSPGGGGSGGTPSIPGNGGSPGTGGNPGSGGSPDAGAAVDAAAPAPAPDAATGSDAAPAPVVTGHLFGSHSQKYPDGSIRPAGAQADLDAAVAAAYDKWKAAHVAADCGGYYVKSTGETNQVSSSSANGAGLIIVTMLAGHDPDAQKIADGIIKVSRAFPSYLEMRGNNLAYAILKDGTGKCSRPAEGDSSVRGDLDFAFGLLLAERQWGSAGAVKYLDEAKKSVPSIETYDFNPTSRVPLIGDWASLPTEPEVWKTSTMPPNFMLGHFRAFAQAGNAMFWQTTIDKLQALTTATITKYSASAGLLPLYLDNGTTPPPGKRLSDENGGHYVGEAGSIPLRLAADYIASGDAQTRMNLDKIVAWVKGATGGDPAKIVDGYHLDGSPIATTGTVEFLAPFASAAIFSSANQAWVDAAWKLMVAAPTGSQDAETANLLNMLVVSGNWWQP